MFNKRFAALIKLLICSSVNYALFIPVCRIFLLLLLLLLLLPCLLLLLFISYFGRCLDGHLCVLLVYKAVCWPHELVWAQHAVSSINTQQGDQSSTRDHHTGTFMRMF